MDDALRSAMPKRSPKALLAWWRWRPELSLTLRRAPYGRGCGGIGGAERHTEAARALGYADGSALAHAPRRMARSSIAAEAFAHRLHRYERELESTQS